MWAGPSSASWKRRGELILLLIQSLLWLLRPPFRVRQIFKQMEFVGVKSINVVLLTGVFTGAVFALQSYHGFSCSGPRPWWAPPWPWP